MHDPDSAPAYLVTAYELTPSGELVEDGGTVCFDLEMALEMAEADLAAGVGVSVYALDAQGQPLGDAPLFCSAAPAAALPGKHGGLRGPRRCNAPWVGAPGTFM